MKSCQRLPSLHFTYGETEAWRRVSEQSSLQGPPSFASSQAESAQTSGEDQEPKQVRA